MPYGISTVMSDIRFRGKISSEGDRLVIVIPKAFREMLLSVKGKELLIELTELKEKEISER